MLHSLSGHSLGHYQGVEPRVDLKAYFDGPIKAWGLIQDWRGRVVTRFDVDLYGEWEGEKGTLREDFRYYNGDTQQRVWHIERLAPGLYKGAADDIIGTASGRAEGNALNWHYQMELPVDGRVYRVKFDDWMWLMNDGVLINRSYIKKFGFTVAELTLFMQKAAPEKAEAE